MKLVKISLKNKKIINSSYDYWNDETIEKSKAYNVIDNGFLNLKNSKKIIAHIKIMISYLNYINFDFENKNIFSLASGVCYSEAVSLEIKNFKKLTCIDFSKHRIHHLAPKVFSNFNLLNKNIELIKGDFENFNTK